MAASPTSVILPAYVPNEELEQVTHRCLQSLEATVDRGAFELVIIENGSRVLWNEDIRRSGGFEHYLGFDEPLGYARAANIGLAVAKYDWLCVINTDIEFKGPWLDQLQRDYLKTPGGILSTFDDKLDAGRPSGIHMDESWFSCFLTHRSVIQKVGYFDESMPYRFHDQDYAIRVKQAGYEVMRDGNVFVSHIDSATYNTMNHDPSEERQQMIQKHGAWCFDAYLAGLGANTPAV